MTDALLRNEGVQLVLVAVGFVLCLGLDAWRNSGALNRQPVTSNAGSRMNYLIWQAAIAVAYYVLLVLFALSVIKLFRGATPPPYYLILAVISLLAGAAFGFAALLRAKDAGFGRKGALLGITPLTNIALIFAPPRDDPERPPYVPANQVVRIGIALCAVALFFALIPVRQVARNMLIDTNLADISASGVVKHGSPPLPETLAEETKFVKIYNAEWGITYRYEVSGPELDADRISAFVTETLKPQLQKRWCVDEDKSRNITDAWYEYVDQQGTALASVLIIFSKGACRKLHSEQDGQSN